MKNRNLDWLRFLSKEEIDNALNKVFSNPAQEAIPDLSGLPKATPLENIHYYFLYQRARRSIKRTNLLCNKFAPSASYINRTVEKITKPGGGVQGMTVKEYLSFVIYRHKIYFVGKRFRSSLNRLVSLGRKIEAEKARRSFRSQDALDKKLRQAHLKYPLTINPERDIDWSK